MNKMSWLIKQWKDVLSIVNGKNQKEVQSDNGMFPIIGSGGEIGRANDFLCEAGSTVVGRKGTINNPFFVGERFWNVDTAFGIQPGKKINPKFLFYFCKSYNFKKLDKSTTIPSLAKTDLLKIEMPVPPLDEQEKIVNRIEELFSELDSAVETLKKIKEQLTVYRQSVLKEAFEGPYSRVPLKEISKVINGYAFKSKLYSDNGNYVVVKIGNVKQLRFDFARDYTKTTEYSEQILAKYLLKDGDCLITLTGSRGKRDYGFVAMIDGHKNYLLNQRVAALRFDKNKAFPKYYQYYLSSPDYRNQFFSYETGNVGQGNVGIKALSEPLVVCPELKIQERIVVEIERRMSVCDNIEKTVNDALAQAEAMRQSILKKAFEGEL